MERIFLVGLPGSGKTHWAEKIAAALGWRFIDLDTLIETREKMSIPEIFGQFGENHFRQLENKYLNTLSLEEQVVVAAGGGTPCFHANMDLMNALGETYYLKVSVDTVVSRLQNKTAGRPLLSAKNNSDLFTFLSKQLREREPFYRQAKHVVDEETLSENNLREVFAAAAIQER